jgi:DNA-binding response OmpR family regulator
MEQNILLVDDEEALQLTVGDRLRKEGYRVDCASDAESGLKKATSLPFDLMILDVMLPGRNGLDLCQEVRFAGLDTPILLLSARSKIEDKVVGFKSGADAYVTKPFDMLELVARVEALLRRVPAKEPITRGPDRRHNRSTRHSKAFKAQPTARQLFYSAVPRETDLREEFGRKLTTHKNSRRLAEIVPRLRNMLNEEHICQTTRQDRGFLSVADGIVAFLEDMIGGIWSPRQRY